MDNLRDLILAAKERRCQLLIRNARVVNVFTREILQTDVGLAGGLVLGLGGEWTARRELDAEGAYLTPGLIDGHLHIESSMAHPARLARAVLAQGTTALIADPHEIANVAGKAGLSYMLQATEGLPLRVWFMLPSCVPCTEFETSGATLCASDLAGFKEQPRVLGLAEAMDYVAVTTAAPQMLAKLELFRDRPIDGHAPLLSGPALEAYCLAGPASDHECSRYEEVVEKLRAGMHIHLRYGSACRGVEEILARIAAEKLPTERMLFCTDDKHLENIRAEGHINFILARAVANGLDPLEAVAMATINAARCYGLRRYGAVAPGYAADLVLFEDLKDFRVRRVIVDGQPLEEAVWPALRQPQPQEAEARVYHSVRLAPRTPDSLRLPARPDMPVIRLRPGEILTQLVRREVPQRHGCFVAGEGLLKLAVLERHQATGRVGLGVLEGLPLKNGAIAATVGHDSHNLIVAGDNDRDMLRAIDALEQAGGGYAVVGGGELLALLELPVAGLMSEAPLEEILRKQRELLAAAAGLGADLSRSDPFITLSFLALPVIPEARLTDKGMFQVNTMSFIS